MSLVMIIITEKLGGIIILKKVISSQNAPAAVGAYSQGIQTENLVFSSGQLGLDPMTGLLVEGGVSAQAMQVMKNIGAILEEANVDFSDIIKTTIFLKNIEDFEDVNNVYKGFFSGHFPARSCFAVSTLPKNALVEIEVIAKCKQ